MGGSADAREGRRPIAMRIVWWLATVFGIGLVSIILSEQKTLDPVHNLSLSITAPVESGLRDIASPINDIYDGITVGPIESPATS